MPRLRQRLQVAAKLKAPPEDGLRQATQLPVHLMRLRVELQGEREEALLHQALGAENNAGQRI